MSTNFDPEKQCLCCNKNPTPYKWLCDLCYHVSNAYRSIILMDEGLTKSCTWEQAKRIEFEALKLTKDLLRK